MEDKKTIEQNETDSNEKIEFDKRLEAYKKMLERQRKWLEAHPNVKVAYYVPPKKKDSDD